MQPQVKYPKVQSKTPKCGWLWQMIKWIQVTSAQVPYLFKCDSVTISQPHIKLMWSHYMPLLYTHLAKYSLCLSPTPNMWYDSDLEWAQLAEQTSHCRHNLLVGTGREGAPAGIFWNTRLLLPQKSRAAFIVCSKLPKIATQTQKSG